MPGQQGHNAVAGVSGFQSIRLPTGQRASAPAPSNGVTYVGQMVSDDDLVAEARNVGLPDGATAAFMVDVHGCSVGGLVWVDSTSSDAGFVDEIRSAGGQAVWRYVCSVDGALVCGTVDTGGGHADHLAAAAAERGEI